MDVSLSVRFTATERRERGAARRVLIDRGPAERALARRSMHGTLRHRSGALAARCRWNVIRSFIMKSGCRSCALAAASSSALGISRRKITHTYTSIWAMPVRSAAPIALRYSVSIRAWVHTKLIRQIVLTVTWTELPSCSAYGNANSTRAPPCRISPCATRIARVLSIGPNMTTARWHWLEQAWA